MDRDTFDFIYYLHNNMYPETILSSHFSQLINPILTKSERTVLGLKVQFYEDGWEENTANKEIAKLLKIRLTSVVSALYKIRSKVRKGMDTRVDNKLEPAWYYNKKRKRDKNNESIRANTKSS